MEQGAIIESEVAKLEHENGIRKEGNGMKIKEQKVMYVSFKSCGMAYCTVTIYEGKSLNECLKMRSEDIDGVIIDGMYIKID